MKKLIDNNIFRLVLVILFLAVCAGVGSGMAYVNYESNPTDEATKYFRALVAEDYDTMYSLLNIKDGTYINKNAYKDRMKKIRDSLVIDSYEFSEPYKSGKQKIIEIVCEDENEKTSQTLKLVFDEVKGRNLIIPDYKVNIDEMLVDNLKISVPKGDTLYIGDETITKDNAEVKNDGDKDIYSFKSILYGAYYVKALNQYSQVSTYADILKKDTNIELSAKNYIANDKYEAAIVKNADAVISKFYKAVRKRKSGDKKLLSYFAKGKKLQKKVKKAVEESQKVVYWPETKNIDSYKVISFDMGKLQHKSEYAGNNKFTVTYDFVYKYVSSTDTAIFTSYTYNIAGSCKTHIVLTYTVKGDGVELTDISVKNKNSKNKVGD